MRVLGLTPAQWRWRMQAYKRRLSGLFSSGPQMHRGAWSLTQIIIVTNLALFSLMVLMGAFWGVGLKTIFSPPTQLLVIFGGQFWPQTINYNQWWRCISYAFTHGGIIHLGFNMMVLMQIGPMIEGTIGKSRFLVLYLITALVATLAGYLWHPTVVVVGASGSLFGLIGFAISYFHRIGGPMSIETRDMMIKWALFALVFGFLIGADNAAHIGGGLSGAALGYIYPISVRAQRSSEKLFQTGGMVCATIMVLSLAVMLFNVFLGAING